MGYKVEHNTMLRLNNLDEIDINSLELNKSYEIKRDNARLYPVNIPILFLAEDWRVLGYLVIKELELSDQGSEMEFEIIKLFTSEVQEIYTIDLKEVLVKTGYLN
jgi:hypothetical protein